MIPILAESTSTWAEDTALQRCTRSAAPGVGVKTGPDDLRSGHSPTSHQHQSAKPSRHDAAKSPTGCPLSLANANRPKFQLPVNQDITAERRIAGIACLRRSRDSISFNRSGLHSFDGIKLIQLVVVP
jgi:hypothetical protein